jgi:hypothetical protein
VSADVVALLREEPDLPAALDALALLAKPDGSTTQVYDPAGRLVVSICEPVLVRVAGEVERLLGVAVPEPVWWVDVRAAGGLYDAQQLGRRLADELARRCGGTVWTAP